MRTDHLPLIDVQQVTYAPGGVSVLRDVNFQSDASRIGIVGRNGSGKTSLLRVMAGLVPPDQGHVTIAGVDVAKDRKAVLGAVGILFQNPDHQIIFPTVQEEIAFGLMQMGQAKMQAAEGVVEVLRRFDRTHWAEAPIHQLSQGQRQLVCLMSVLAMRPKVILLDEPFAGLDIPTTLHLQRVLAGINGCIIQITHDPAMVADYDHVLWIEGGQLAGEGPAQQVLPAFTDRMHEIGGRDDLSHLAG